MLPTTLPGDDFESMNRAALLAWEERQRRQRTLRTLMMLLMFLLLMDGEEPPDRRNARLRQQRLRNQHRNGGSSTGHGGGGGDSYKVGMYFDEDGNDLTPLQEEVFQRRRDQDDVIRRSALFNPKSKHYELIKLNNGRDVEAELMALVRNKMQKEIESAAVEEYNDETATDTNMKTTDTAAAAAAESSSSPKADDNNNSGKQQTQSEQQTNDELQ
eukprot:scaffold9810_cov109-Skeletonema_marinoi.AAC.2